MKLPNTQKTPPPLPGTTPAPVRENVKPSLFPKAMLFAALFCTGLMILSRWQELRSNWNAKAPIAVETAAVVELPKVLNEPPVVAAPPVEAKPVEAAPVVAPKAEETAAALQVITETNTVPPTPPTAPAVVKTDSVCFSKLSALAGTHKVAKVEIKVIPKKKVSSLPKPPLKKRNPGFKKRAAVVAPVILSKNPSVLDKLVEERIVEGPLMGDFHANRFQSALLWEPAIVSAETLPVHVFQEGEVQPSDYSELREKIKEHLFELDQLEKEKAPAERTKALDLESQVLNTKTPELSPVLAQAVSSTPTVTDSSPSLSTPSIVAPVLEANETRKGELASAKPLASGEPDTVSAPEIVVLPARDAAVMPSTTELPVREAQPQEAAVSIPTLVTTPKTTIQHKVVTPPAPIRATQSAGESGINTVTDNKNELVTPEPEKKESTENRESSKGSFASSFASSAASTQSGIFYGKITFDKKLTHWLEAQKGHVELTLHPVGTKDPEQIRFVTYRFPADRFEFNGRGLKGKYQLVAALYKSKQNSAVAYISYPKPILAENFRENIVFHLKRADIKSFGESRSRVFGKKDLTLTVFEGLQGDVKQPKVIAGATAHIMGYSHIPERSDAEGNIRFPAMPANSEILIALSAKGYYDTRVVVPIGDTDTYQPIYLVPRDKVDTVTRFFTKKEQKENKSVIVGRVFDPETRETKSGVQASLSGRKGRPVYFGSLPDLSLKETSDAGLFAFFNVEKAFRSLTRSGSDVPMLLNVGEAMGYYVEFGRGGEKILRARFLDPFSKNRLHVEVGFVGAQNKVETDENGNLYMNSIDVGPGVLTLESTVEGYPITWHNIPWNSREASKERALYMIPNEVIDGLRSDTAKLSNDPSAGSIFGGGDTAFFSQPKGCVTISLDSTNGSQIGDTHGPYAIVGGTGRLPKDLCLTRENPGFAFFNIPPGEYLLKWTDETKHVLQSHVIHVGVNRTTVAVY